MDEKHISAAGLILELSNPIQIPEQLREFLTRDEMNGIEDFNFMLTNSKLFMRIPHETRIQYEIIYCNLSQEIDEVCDFLEHKISEMRSNQKEIIHELIQQSLEATHE